MSDYDRLSSRDKLAVARLRARTMFPYFSSALLGLIPKEAPGLRTIGVTAKMVMYVDFDAINTWPLEELTAALVHEVGHVLRDHAGRCKSSGADQKLFNIAGDAEINDDLVAAFPETVRPSHGAGDRGFILPSSFQMADGLTAEEYYSQLQQKQAEQEANSGGSGKPDVGRGWCGSSAGRSLPNEEADGAGSGKPGDTEGRSQAEIARIRKTVAADIKAAQSGRGSVPAGWARWAENALQPPKVRWQDKLARMARGATAWKSGAYDYRHTHISRRQAGLGFGAGKPVLPALRAPIPQIAVIADTSGSMGKKELGIVLRETRGVLKTINARVTFAACDAAVRVLKPVSSWQELPKLLLGGGGTDFRPAFEQLSNMKRNRPDVVIFCTDGGGPAPKIAPTGYKVIWVLTGSHARKPCEWGTIIEVMD